MSPHKRTRKPISGRSPGPRSQTSVNITQHSSSRGPPIAIDGASKIRKTGRRVVRRRNKSGQRGPDHTSPRVTIEALPDDVLLDIFDFYRAATSSFPNLMLDTPWPWPWNRLVHVCQRWRYVVFGSPLRLDLCLRCTSKTPVRGKLDVWPPLPIEICVNRPCDVDNIIATLEHRDRIRKIWIMDPTSSQLERLAPMMQEPFPVLTSLLLDVQVGAREIAPALPDTFLGGSAPRLQILCSKSIPFLGLPRLLLSASNLSDLFLWRIPHTGYISPEAMVTGLSALTRLISLTIEFESPASRPDRRGRRPPPLTRVILPALVELRFRGVSEYLEDLVARIDAPRLRTLRISFFNQLIFDIQQLPYFIGHAGILRSYNRAKAMFGRRNVEIVLRPPLAEPQAYPYQELTLGILCRDVDWQVSCMAELCSQPFFLLSSVEELDIQHGKFDPESTWQVEADEIPWLELFRPFTAVRTLRVSRKLQSLIVPALQELIGERATEVLPALDSLYLEEHQSSGSDQQAIEPFIAAREYSDHPVAVHPWEGR